MKSRHIFAIVLAGCIFIGLSCKKLVEVNPPITAISSSATYANDQTAIAALTGIYTQMSIVGTNNTGSILSLSLDASLSADELTLWSGEYNTNPQELAYYRNELSASLGYGSEYWSTIYPYIFLCNNAIDNLNESSALTASVKQQLLGEAKFMRAFFYFYLVNLYGDVPLPLTSNYKTNSSLNRTPSSEVYLQIIADLHDAEHLLSPNYLDETLLNSSLDRIRPTNWAATALLARAYLYTGNYAGADSASSILINNSSVFSLSGLDTTFLRANINGLLVNKEAIWQLQPVTSSPSNTIDALDFVIPPTGLGTGLSSGFYLSSMLLDTFETADNRRTHWIDSTIISGITYYYPYKYKISSSDNTVPVTEYYMIFRLGEQYLIRAEARANTGNLLGSQADLNSIRGRAGLNATSTSSQSGLISAIRHERQVELFTELGQRWLDLKRYGTIDAVMSQVAPRKDGGTWSSYKQYYPIASGDIQLDPNLAQNSGY